MISYNLTAGRKSTGISVEPDPIWPQMWRIHQGTRVSDMVNLTRAKDAAISWAIDQARGGRGGLGPEVVIHWNRCETRLGRA